MILKDYQKNAVESLLKFTRKLLGKDGQRICVLKAPTGSGKTIMMADFLNELAQEKLPREYAVLWISSHDLHTQSKEKLENYLKDSSYSFSLLEEITGNEFNANEIVFVNWHKLSRKKDGEWNAILMRENEKDRNLQTFVRNTKKKQRYIILVVDESQYYYWSEQNQEIVNEIISPDLTIEVSATPKIEPSREDERSGDAGYIEVKFEDVVEAEIIKKDVIVNREIGKFANLQTAADEGVIDAAIAKREELFNAYKEEKVKINPLLLIQLPSESQTTSALDRSTLEHVEKYLADEHEITVENGKLAIWLSDKKENLENITKLSDKAEVLIFKQAIALGWDCPRAQILVMLREIGSITFEIQTVGRIMRMPEVKHYENEELNSAYIYTNLPKISVSNDDNAQKYYQTFSAKRNASYKPVGLPSVYLKRIDFGDLTLSFRGLFSEEANKRFKILAKDSASVAYKKADKDLELYDSELTRPVIADALIENIDEAKDIIGDQVEFAIPEEELKYRFEQFAKLTSLPFAPVRSHTKIQMAIYEWFDKALGYSKKSRLEIQKAVVCSATNQKIFKEIIEAAKERFRSVRKQEQAEKQQKKQYKWDVPVIDYYSEKNELTSANNYAMDKCYLLSGRSRQEREFEDLLNRSDQAWWYKNGTGKETYFAIQYTDPKTGLDRAFYPDYIIRKKDGSVGIFDTKSGFTASEAEATPKSDALQEYIKKNKGTFGGIVQTTNTGTFVFTGKKYSDDLSQKGWERLEI